MTAKYVRVPAESLINRLGMNLPLSVFDHLEVVKREGLAKVGVRVTPEWYREHRQDAKTTLNQIRDRARQEGLEAHYNPKGTWLVIHPKLG